MAKGDIVTLFPSGLEQRTSVKGKDRFSIRVDAEPVYVNLDAKALGKDIALAVAEHLRKEVLAISARASDATLKARKVAAKALTEGKTWAMKRYMGGRTVSGPPNQSDRLFNDSGRFAQSIVAGAGKDNAWRVNVAANRLSGDPASVQRIYAKLVELVPEFGNVALLFEKNEIVRAKKRTAEKMVQKGPMKKAGGGLLDLLGEAMSLFERVDRLVS